MLRTLTVGFAAGVLSVSVAAAAPVSTAWSPARNVSNPGGSAFFPSVFSSADGNRLTATWHRITVADTRVQVIRSADAGQTWSNPVDISGVGGVSFFSRIDGSLDGMRATVVWVRNILGGNGIQASSTSDGGATWSAPLMISNVGDARRAEVVTSTDGIRAIATWQHVIGGKYLVQTARSTDAGATWAPAETLSAAGFDANDSHLAASGDASRVAAIWERNNVIQSAFSVDGGGTWSSPAPVSSPGQLGLSPQITASADGTRVVAIWSTDVLGAARITVSVSTDGAATWSAPQFISAPGVVARIPQIAMSSDGSRVTAVWNDGPDAQARRVMGAHSTDGGTSWTAPLQVSEDGLPLNLNALASSADGSRLTAAWLRSDGTNDRVQTSSSTDHGASWSTPATLSAAGKHGLGPVVATSANGIRVAALWGRSDGVDQRVQDSTGIVASVPGAPGLPTASPGNAAASVTWTGAEDGGSPVSSYTATANPGGRTCTTAGTSCTVDGLTNGKAYTFTVSATNSLGAGPASAASAPVTPNGALVKRTRAVVKPIARKSKLRVVVKPNLGPKKQWRFTVQRKAGKWRKVGTYRTVGSAHRRVLNLPKGKYRVVVKPARGHKGSTSRAVRLTR